MIGRLSGTLVELTRDSIILDIHDVGYQIAVTERWRQRCHLGEQYILVISTQVREDAIMLFGFESPAERTLFELLLGVSGIGPKTSLAIVGQGVEETNRAIATADVDFFLSIPRIGKKNAQKIIIELKSKIGGFGELDLSGTEYGRHQELMDALVGMGFSKAEIANVIKQQGMEDVPLEEAIRMALRLLGKK